MANIRTCANGHNYDSEIFKSCPYCPKGSSDEKTIVKQSNNLSTNNDLSHNKTRIVSPVRDFIGSEDPTKAFDGVALDNRTKVPNGTKIVAPGNEPNSYNEVHSRKLVGFLVSYSLNPQGKSFKLYEGKNLIGTDPSCDISIGSDSGISGKHLTILYRSNKFRFKDEFSTNATFINGHEMEEGYLENFDSIRIGKTKFIFIAIPFDTGL